jgi:hypothetical protein
MDDYDFDGWPNWGLWIVPPFAPFVDIGKPYTMENQWEESVPPYSNVICPH